MLPVVWTFSARVSLVETMSFLQELSEDAAARLLEEVEATIQKIIQFNKICPPSLHKPRYHRCVMLDGRVSLYYMVKKTRIEIIAVRDNRRKPKF